MPVGSGRARLQGLDARPQVIQAELRVTNGGHDWDVWEPAFVDGLTLLT